MKKKKKLGCIIFARYDSKRLRGKVLKNVCNKPLLEIIYLRLTKVFSKDNIVIATSKDKEDKEIIANPQSAKTALQKKAKTSGKS